MRAVNYNELYEELHEIQKKREEIKNQKHIDTQYPKTYNALKCIIHKNNNTTKQNTLQNTANKTDCRGMSHMQNCVTALKSLDNTKWQRSFHQKQFHDNFLRASARVFFKNSPPGSFNRQYQHILKNHGWDHLAQEILVSTPRRFGKTISVSMFAAAILYSAPSVEVSIYSTCKRISQKLLRNVYMFLCMIHENTSTPKFKIIRSNMEEVVMMGPEGNRDTRTINSYPSKVSSHNRSCCNFYCFSLLFFYFVKSKHPRNGIISNMDRVSATQGHSRIFTTQDTTHEFHVSPGMQSHTR
jgi:hypothetical protein